MSNSLNNLCMLAIKTFMAYSVFILSFFSIPFLNDYSSFEPFKSFLSEEKDAVIGETAIKIEIADTLGERVQGLSYRDKIEKDKGLLFIFDNSDFHGIWMKDMRFSIDIIWLDQNLQVIHMEESVSPDTYPDTFSPNKKALYVLEVYDGFVSDNNILMGDQMTIL